MEVISSIRKNSIGLGIFAIVTAGLIAVTQQVTKERIQDNVLHAQQAAFSEILPDQYYDNDLYKSQVTLEPDLLLGTKEASFAYIGRIEGEFSGIIFESIAPGGYNGSMSLLVAINRDGVVTGSRVIRHQETPGLGDKIDMKKSDWMRSFENKSFDNLEPKRWKVKRDNGDFDQFTGATITPRAIVKSVKNTLEYFHQHKAELIKL
ncbi:electron transport complex protein RnfG [Marinomonas sp. MED121]|uniref:electron transport complex subunit RsxG n=1 Tax=Marinomonas sp. MED121 TaxID=314277 RepID=UPI00006910C4|nr:electron transport complex subunit RsxG [Marinomonas sp. MED121]EAQ67287.1 electron transport complex protein RnfG [Marinomonas sp. MED121]